MNQEDLNKQKIIDFNMQKNQLLELFEIMKKDELENTTKGAEFFIMNNKKSIFVFPNFALISNFENDTSPDSQNLIQILNNADFLNKIDYLKDNLRRNEEAEKISKVVEEEVSKTVQKTNEILEGIKNKVVVLQEKKYELEEENIINTESLYEEVEKKKELIKKHNELVKKYNKLFKENKRNIEHINKIANEKTPKTKEKIEIKGKNYDTSNIIKAEDINKVKTKNNKEIIDEQTIILYKKEINRLEEEIRLIIKEHQEAIEVTENDIGKKYIIELNKQKKDYEKEISTKNKELSTKNDELIKKELELVTKDLKHKEEIEEIKKILKAEHQNEILEKIIQIYSQKK